MNITSIPEFDLANTSEIADIVERMVEGDKIIIDGVTFEFMGIPSHFAYPEPARFYLNAPMPETDDKYSTDPDRGYNFLHLRKRDDMYPNSLGDASFTREDFCEMIRAGRAYIG